MTKSLRKRRRARCLPSIRWIVLPSAIAAAFGLGVACASGANVTWDSSGTTPSSPVAGSGTWDLTTKRWSNGSKDAVWSNTGSDTAKFGNPGLSTPTLTLAAPLNAAGLTFAGGSYFLTDGGNGSNGLDLGATGSIQLSNGAYVTVSSQLYATLATLSGSGTFVTSGAADNSGSGFVVGSGVTLVCGKTYNTGHAIGGSNTTDLLVKSGGLVQLMETGSAGQVSGQLYVNAKMTINSGGTLDMNGDSENATSLNLSGKGISNGGALINSAVSTTSTLTLNSVSLLANTNIGGAGNLVIDAPITGAFAVTITGSGTQTFSGANTYNGGTTVSGGGTLVVEGAALNSAPQNYTVASGSTLNLVGDDNNDVASGNSTISGSGTLLVTGTTFAEAYHDFLNISMGTQGVSSNALIHIASGATLVNGGFQSTLWSSNYASMTIDKGGTLDLWNGNPVQIDALNGAGVITVGDGAYSSITLGINNGSGAFSGTIQSDVAVTKVGTGTQALSGNNTYTLGTTISAGALSIGSDANLGDPSGSLTFTGGTLLLTAGINSSRSVMVGAGGGTIDTGSFSSTFSGPVSGGGLAVIDNGSLTLSGNDDNSSLGVTVNNGATVVLAKNSSAGVHAVGGGGLVINSGGTAQLAGSGNYQVYGSGTITVNSGGVFDLNGQSQDNSGMSGSIFLGGTGIKGGGALINSAAATTSTLTLYPDTLGNGVIFLTADSSIGGAGNLVINAPISGPHAVTITGSGTQTFSGANTYSGGTTISGGTLVVQGAALASAPQNYAVASGAILNLVGDGNNDVASGTNTISGSGTLLVTGTTFAEAYQDYLNISLGTQGVGSNALIHIASGATLVNGGFQSTLWSSNYASMTIDKGGTFDLWNGNPVQIDALNGAGVITVGDGAYSSITIGTNNGSGAFSGTIQSDVSVTKVGTGTQVLSGNNTYTLGTTVSAGILLANAKGSSATGTGDVTVISGGTLGGGPRANGGAGQISGNVTIGSGVTQAAAGNISAGNAFTNPSQARHTALDSDTGALTIGGNLTLQGPDAPLTTGNNVGGTYFWKIDASNGTHDQIAVSGSVIVNTANGAFNLVVEQIGPDVLAPTRVNGIIASASAIDIYSNPANPTTFTAYSVANGNVPSIGVPLPSSIFAVSDNTNGYGSGWEVEIEPDSNGSSVDLVVTGSVPEPATLGLLGIAATGLLLRRRSRTLCRN